VGLVLNWKMGKLKFLNQNFLLRGDELETVMGEWKRYETMKEKNFILGNKKSNIYSY
jgi:hypothetical protein